jgi:cytochrome b561
MIHSGVGVVILLMMTFRWWWRRSRKLYARWWKRPSMVLQWVLYPLVIAQVLIGVTQAAFVDYDVVAFGFIPFSALAAANGPLHDSLLLMHELMAWVLILLVAAHGIERGRFAFIEDVSLMKTEEA